MTAVAGRSAGVVAGLVLDRWWGDPPSEVHPVALFGRAMEGAERQWWHDGRGRGVWYAAAGVAAAASAGWLAESVAGRAGGVALATAVASAGRTLLSTATEVGDRLHAGDLAGARALLPSLVGRDPSSLGEQEMARAVVESVAENLSDAVVATALWGRLAGAPGALAHRAANTLDAMVGHRSPRYARFGWAAARLDDVMAWPAARVTALLVMAVSPGAAGQVRRAVRRDAPHHPSPNAGVAEAAFAGALGLRLGGVNHYQGRRDRRPSLGSGRPAEVADIGRAVALARRVTRLLGLVLLAVAATGVPARRRAAGGPPHPRAHAGGPS